MTIKKIVLCLSLAFITIFAWAPWLSDQKAKEIVHNNPHFYQLYHAAEDIESNTSVKHWPFCRIVVFLDVNVYYEGRGKSSWFVCFWQGL